MKTRTCKLPMPLERDIQRAGMALLRSLDWVVMRRNTGAMRATYRGRERLVRFSEVGASDTYGIINPGGFHFECEFKRPGEWPTPAQIAWLKSMNGIGGSVAFWVSSLDDLEEVARHVMAGGRIEFVGDEGQYRLIGGNDAS